MGKKRLLIVGWDGAPYDKIQPWIEKRELPTLEKIVKNGSFGPLKTTPLTISSCAWTTMATGNNAGKHGVYDFFGNNFLGDTYLRKPENATSRKTQTFWNKVSKYDLKIGLVNVPYTFPAERTNGFMIGGMLSPGVENKNFTYPINLLKDYEKLNDYIIDIEGAKEKDRTEFVQEIYKTIDERTNLIIHLLEQHDLDIFFCVYTSPDRFSHYLWHFFDEDHPYRKNETYDEIKKYEKSLLELYKKLDRSLEKICDSFSPTDTIVLSDHGFSSIYRFFHINKWLQQKGYLKFKPKEQWVSKDHAILNPDRKYIFGKVDWNNTVAYSIGKRGTVYINLADREPNGIVKKTEYDKIVSELIEELKQVKDPMTDKRVVRDVLSREQIFNGKQLDKAPDILIFFKPGYTSLGYAMELDSPELFMSNDRTDIPLEMGIERGHGIICFSGQSFLKRTIEKATLEDIAPTLLHLFGIRPDEDIDGKILDVFGNEHSKSELRKRDVDPLEKQTISKLLKQGKI